MGIVWPCRLAVEDYAGAGREVAAPRLSCPDCRQRLIFWSGYERFARRAGKSLALWIRRGKCTACGVTHALLPVFLLRHRLDPAAVIGGTVAGMVVRGVGARTAAEEAGVPHTTARDWRRRHRARAPNWLARAEALVVELGGELSRPDADVEHAALDALVDAWRRAAARRPNDPPLGLWSFVSAISGGSWLSTTTSPPWAGASGRPLIATTSSTAP